MSGQPAARLGDATLKGGPIVQGSAGVMIGAINGKACSTCPGGMAVGNPVNPMLGAKVLTNEMDVALSGDLSFIVSRNYSSYQTKTPAPVGMFGPGWQSQVELSLTVTDSQIILHDTSNRSLYFESLLEGGIGYSQSENVWIIRGGAEELLVKGHVLTALWESLPLEIRLNRNYYFVTNRILGPLAVLGYITPFVPDNQTFLPQPLDERRVLIMESDLFHHQIHYHRVPEGSSKGKIIKVTDGVGREYRLNYESVFLNSEGEEKDPKRNLNASIDAGYGRDSGLRLSEVYLVKDPVYEEIPLNPLVRYHYNERGELTHVFDRAGDEVRFFQYDTQHLGRMTGHRYEGRPLTSYEYNSQGFVSKQHNPKGLDYLFRYEDSAAEVEDSLGRKDRYEFSGEGGLKRLVKHTRKDGSIIRNEFDQHGRMVAQYDALDRKTEYSLDIASGLLIKTTTHDGREFKFDYNRMGQLTTRISPNGQRNSTEFDHLGRMIAQTDALGEKTRYDYEGETNRISKIIDHVGKEKMVTWTEYGQVASFTDCSGKSQHYQYDQWGNTLRTDYEEGLFECYEYDAKGRLIATTNPTEDITRYSYNKASDTIKVTLPDGRVQESTYNPWGAILSQSFAGGVIQYRYDKASRLRGLKNENSAEMHFEYDLMDRTTLEKGFDDRTKRVKYDALGRITDSYDNDLHATYHYDEQDRLISKLLHHPNGESQETSLSYGELGLDQIVEKQAERAIGVSYYYDKIGRLAKESQWVEADDATLWQYDVAHQYSKLGFRESSQYQGLPEIHYQTYGAGHLIGVLMDGESLIDFERDNLHRESKRQFGSLELSTLYNQRGELEMVLAKAYAHFKLNREYLYDQAGQLTTTLTRQGEIQYHYDLRGRLTGAESYDFKREYQYDQAGNILPQEKNPYYQAFEENRVQEDAAYFYFYDQYGNLDRKNHKEKDERHYFVYDGQHRLKHYERYEENQKVVESHYQYDPVGRRISKQSEIYRDGKLMDEPHYWYGWDGDRLVTTEHEKSRIHTIYEPTSFKPLIRLEQSLPLPEVSKALGDIMEAEMAETGIKLPKQVKDRFNRVEEEINAGDLSQEMANWLATMQMTEERIKADFMPEKAEKQALTKHYYHTDQIGTPLALVNEQGEIDWEIVIDPYGNRVREENPNKLYQPIRMQGHKFAGAKFERLCRPEGRITGCDE